jgi:hypothetical protein
MPFPANPLTSSGRSATIAQARLESSRNDLLRSRRSALPPPTQRADRNRFEPQACSARLMYGELDRSRASLAPSTKERRESCFLRPPAAPERSLEPCQNLSSCLAWHIYSVCAYSIIRPKATKCPMLTGTASSTKIAATKGWPFEAARAPTANTASTLSRAPTRAMYKHEKEISHGTVSWQTRRMEPAESSAT